eukprot:248570_1
MLGPIYSLCNLVVWSLSTLLWLIWWLFIVVVGITCIGFINVQFFTKNNGTASILYSSIYIDLTDTSHYLIPNTAEYKQMIKRQQQLARTQLHFLSPQHSLNPNIPSDESDEKEHDSDVIDFTYPSARNRAHRARKKQEIPDSIDPLPWNMSRRLTRQDTPPSQSSPSDSMQSSQYKFSKTFDEDSDQHTSLPSVTSRNGSSLLSPDHVRKRDNTHFAFKLTPRMGRKKREQQHHRTQ